MTKVSIYELADSIFFECKGHAGYAKHGKDIVCAGISALCMAAVNELDDLAAAGETYFMTYHIADGELSFEIALPENEFSRIKLRTVMDTVRAGLEAIERCYPENLELQ